MRDEGPPRSSRTVFRRSPLQEMKASRAEAARPAQASPPLPPIGGSDDVESRIPVSSRNTLIVAALPLLTLLASVRSGRAEIELPKLHAIVSSQIVRFSEDTKPVQSDENVKRAVYALCATADDIVLNLPGPSESTAEWARRSMVVRYFGEAVGGDRFWMLLDQMIARPAEWQDVLELYHACMACGFMGRFRISPAGANDHQAMMEKAFRALEHPRAISSGELSPHWRGVLTQIRTVRVWTPLMLITSAAAVLLLLVYFGLLLTLNRSAAPAWQSLSAIDDQPPLRLARAAAPPPAIPASTKLQRIRKYLASEIAQHWVEVGEDASVIRARINSTSLFQSGSADLNPNAQLPLLSIADALTHERGRIRVEGYTDSQRISTRDYPNNSALSQARAETVAAILRKRISNPERVTAEGFGESRPIASNATAAGKARNRRVEVTITQKDDE